MGGYTCTYLPVYRWNDQGNTTVLYNNSNNTESIVSGYHYIKIINFI